jgi:small subunit ribosomal protein S1
MDKTYQTSLRILSIESEKERISVSLKELTPNPWNSTIPENYKLGDTVKGKITNITDFGMFVEIEDGVEGLVHISEVEKAQDQTMEELFKTDDEVSARIININTDERKIDLSMKTMFG